MPKTAPDVRIPGPLGRRPRRVRATWMRTWYHALRLIGDVLHRLFDVGLAVLLVVALSPLFVFQAGLARKRVGHVFERWTLVGRFRVSFEKLRFAGCVPFAGLAALFNVLRGDMAFAGPRPLTEAESASIPPGSLIRFDVRPGLVSPFVLRRGTGIAHEREDEIDREFVLAQRMASDVGLVARSIPGTLLGGRSDAPPPPTIELFGITITNTTMDEAVEWVVHRATLREPTQMCYVNPDCLNIAYCHERYRETLFGATRVLPDGIGLHIACRLIGTSLAANVNGTDMFPKLCERLASTELSLFLLGARSGVAAEAGRKMQERFPGLRIAGARDGYFGEEEVPDVLAEIDASGADILLVGLGAPRQDLFIAEHAAVLPVPVRLGVGGLFDYYSGRIARAPIWVRELGLEWLWRVKQEPGRLWKRYFVGNPVFLARVLRRHVGRER